MVNVEFIRKKIVICLLASLVFLSGCWDRIEVNDIAFVMGAAIDLLEDEKHQLTLEVIMPDIAGGNTQTNGSDGGRTTFVVSGEGSTFADSKSKLQKRLSRKLFFGHSRGILFSEDYAKKKGIAGELEYFIKFPETRLRDKVYITSGRANDIIKIPPLIEESTMEALRELTGAGIGLNLTVREVMEIIKDHTRELAVPIVSESEIVGDGEGRSLDLVGTAIFKGDKMIGKIDLRLTRGLLWFHDEMDEAIITIKPHMGEGDISFLMISAFVELIPSIENGVWKITVKLNVEDDVIQNASNVDLIDIDTLVQIESQLEKEIENRMDETRKVLQEELKSDVLGFARAFHREYPDIWNEHKDNWDEIFPNVKVEYDIKAFIRRVGLSTRTNEFY